MIGLNSYFIYTSKLIFIQEIIIMCMYIGIEDLVANAFIELIENSDKKDVLFSQLNQYGATVVKILLEEGQKAVLVLSNERTNSFLHDYSEYFELFTSENGEGLKLKNNVTVDDLWDKFRGYLSFDVMMAFMNKQSLKALGV